MAQTKSKTAKKNTTKKTPAKKKSVKPATKKAVTKQLSKPAEVVAPVKPTRLASVGFGRLYAVISVIILMLTTALWSTLSAKIQQSNADQLVNSYLFESTHTFKEALLPGQHTFLIKWPLFWLVKLLGSTGGTFIGVTIALSLVTVAFLAFVLYKIDKRPHVFGTLCLALASVLTMIPAQSYPGALLPVNMAMIATRNLEYVLYILCLLTLIKWHELKRWGFWLAVLGLGLLIASDKLFLSLSLGGALLAVVAYVFAGRRKLTKLSIKWFAAGVFAAGASLLALWIINVLAITHVSNQTTAGGYAFVHNVNDMIKGSFYAVMGLLTNFGANPAYDGLIVRNMPKLALDRLGGFGGPSFIVNGMIALFGLFVSLRLLLVSLMRQPKQSLELTKATQLSLLLIWTTVAAIGAFIVTDHYYVVDARYLTIALFTLFIAMASYARTKQWQKKRLVLVGVAIVVSMIFGTVFSVNTYRHEVAAVKDMNDRNSLVTQALSHHPVDTLVGDYWRVVPTRAASKTPLNVTPLSNCLESREFLSSKAWQPDLSNHSFAYLLSLDRGLTGYPSCTLSEVITAYGRPNSSAVIAGTLDKPAETLLFYDKGSSNSAPTMPGTKSPATVLPISLDELPNTTCAGLTIMNVVAHQDDDLLFMNPDLARDIQAGHCVRTVYVTAGDAGHDEFYWLSREQGSEAAYSKLIGDNSIWMQRVVKMDEKAFITVANIKGNSKVSIIFVRLPDGNINGMGFGGSQQASLEKLENGQISSIQSVTKQSIFNYGQLTNAIAGLMRVYQPGEIRTQSNVTGQTFTDHSDHRAVGRLAQKAYNQYEQQHFEGRVKVPFKFYLGYPGHEQPQNVFGADLAAKADAFFAYAKYDDSVCQNMSQCQEHSSLGSYLERQYTSPY